MEASVEVVKTYHLTLDQPESFKLYRILEEYLNFKTSMPDGIKSEIVAGENAIISDIHRALTLPEGMEL